jgi:hypothetical protein
VNRLAKTLEMQFTTETGESSNVTLETPKEPIDAIAVKQAMEQVIAANVFYSSKGKLVAVKGVRVIERNVTDYEI